MDSRDDWPDGILEGDLEAVAELDSAEGRSAERIARGRRDLNAGLAGGGGGGRDPRRRG